MTTRQARIARTSRTACLLIVVYLALTLLFTYPLAWHFGTHHVGEAGGDAKVYLWNYWWVKQALFELGTTPFETNLIFHPIGIGLSLHTLAAAQGVVFAPLSEAVGDTAAANLILVLTFLASALATYALARRLGAGVAGSFLAGLVYAFCPYRLARLSGHYDLLGTEWIPLYILLLVILVERSRASAGVTILAGLVAAACGYTALSYLAFLALVTLIVLAFHRERFKELAPRVLVLASVVVLLMAPLLLQMHRDLSAWSYPTYPGADRYVADVAAFIVPPPQSALVPGRAFGSNLTEATVFPGYVLLVLAALGWRHRLWAVTAGVFFVLSLGSSLHIGGADTGIPLPFWLVSHTPLFDNLRAPSRFTIVMVLSLAMMMALSWKPRRRFATAVVAVLIVIEYLAVPIPLFQDDIHEVYARIAANDRVVTVVEIPGIEQSPETIMDHQRFHEKPILVGTAARVPVEKSEYWFGLPLVRSLIDLRKGRLELTSELVERERAAAPEVARFLGIGYFVIDKAYAPRGVVRFVREVLPVDTVFEDDDVVLLRARTEELPRNPVRIDARSPASRQYFESGWMRPEVEDAIGFRWAHRERSTILFRRPLWYDDSIAAVALSIAPLEGGAASVRAELDGESLGTVELDAGWQEIGWELGAESRGGSVERLTLHWSGLARASEHDPRRLAARVRHVRFVSRVEWEKGER